MLTALSRMSVCRRPVAQLVSPLTRPVCMQGGMAVEIESHRQKKFTYDDSDDSSEEVDLGLLVFAI